MKCQWIRHLGLFCVAMAITLGGWAQSQDCPININFASRDLANWSATTGLIGRGTQPYPAPNYAVSVIPEYTLGINGIEVISTSTVDVYGSFPTIPTINGYSYNYAIKLGSTATSHDFGGGGGNPGGFTRAVSYTINVPAGAVSEPYTMTYAYALVLENGTHNSNEQPLFKATLNTPDSIITCASPQYYLPTFNNASGGGGGGGAGGGRGATLDTATALANGFTNSPVAFLSYGGGQGNNNVGQYLNDVWTKNWTEVTFDLSAYRGKQVTLTFESDNCAPGAHFAYAYIALRNICAGLEISGPDAACANSNFTYSIPALANGTYSWEVPTGWSITAGGNTNAIQVTAGTNGGNIIAHEINGCADLRDTITVTSKAPTIPGAVAGDNTVCTGINSTLLTLGGQNGNVISWLSSTNGITWNPVANTGATYTAQNLTATTQFAVVVQNGPTCRLDTSTRAQVTVDPKSVGGAPDPASSSFCSGQTVDALLTLKGSTGSVVNWQLSPNNNNWNNTAPSNTTPTYPVRGVTSDTWYRAIVKSGVCAPDTSDVAVVRYVNVPFPAAAYDPANAVICYGDSIKLNAAITIGTSYTWSPTATLRNQGNGSIPSLPLSLQASAKPLSNTNYILTVLNAGCPNALRDTFKIKVTPPIKVSAGNDTAVVIGQLLQLNATVNDTAANQFTWTPSFGLNRTNIPNPTAILHAENAPFIIYTVRATNTDGCYGTDDIKVKVFLTPPDIFVPNAFSPNRDGRNDVIRPVCVGITQLNFFRLYNRWGQLVFSTSEINKGWDGTLAGVLQPSGTFVYMAQALDYTGKSLTKKGVVVLIR